MERQKLNEKESLEIITSMISRTRNRLCMGDGDLLLLWGYITVCVATTIWALLYMTHHPAVNWLWFLIWIIGGITTPHISKKKRIKKGVKSYTDHLSDGIWSIIGWCALICTIICLVFLLFFSKDCWGMMLVFALTLIGIAEAIQGLIIKEKILIIGGGIGLTIGLITMACLIADITLYANWYMPLFIVAFTCMMIIPGHTLNYKAKRENERS